MYKNELQVDVALINSAERVENSLSEINTRIARLAMSLGACLDTEDDIARILKRQTPFLQAHSQYHVRNPFNHEDERLAHEWEELRGLLALRCELVAHSLKDLGLHMMREITSGIEAQLERDGFKPGADGFDMASHLAS
jgi:hypothetical protein